MSGLEANVSEIVRKSLFILFCFFFFSFLKFYLTILGMIMLWVKILNMFFGEFRIFSDSRSRELEEKTGRIKQNVFCADVASFPCFATVPVIWSGNCLPSS